MQKKKGKNHSGREVLQKKRRNFKKEGIPAKKEKSVRRFHQVGGLGKKH